jgi:hypothetical protein
MGQTQVPLAQMAFVGHLLPQEPQLLVSVCVFTQVLLQQEPVQQTPLQQIWPGVQQVPLHATTLDAQPHLPLTQLFEQH